MPGRVVRIVPDYPVGGMPTYGLQPLFYNLSKAQSKRGHDVHVIANRRKGQPRVEHDGKITVHRVGFPFNITAFRMLRKLSNAQIPTVVHTHSSSGYFLKSLKATAGVPIVSHVHGTTYSAATPTVLNFGTIKNGYSHWGVATSYIREKALWSAADRVAAVSTSVRSDLILRYGIRNEKIRVVYNGVDANVFNPKAALDFQEKEVLEGKRVVLYVGHFGLRKGIPFLIRAMKQVVGEIPDSILVCVGGVPPWLPKGEYWEYLKMLIEENDLAGKVLLIDRIQNDKLPAYYSAASVFVLPSYYEAFPKVLIEAMACEKPVVTSRLGGTVDSVQDGVNGFLVRYGDPDEIAEALVRILQDPKLGRRMGVAGRQLVLREFTWEAVADRVDSIYSEVLGSHDQRESKMAESNLSH
jgi:glycogen(starch) synthase